MKKLPSFLSPGSSTPEPTGPYPKTGVQGAPGGAKGSNANPSNDQGPPNLPGSGPAPSQLGPYQLLRELGRGGMGTVYEAVHTRLKRRVAVKLLPQNAVHDLLAVARFYREMEALGALTHPNIVNATDAGEVNGQHFLVMEYVEGIDLLALVNRCGPLPAAETAELIRQAAVGLQYAHENGRVHRDLKPSNLILSVRGEVKILDLGLALLYEESPAGGELTLSGQVMGTADYMAPEQWLNSHEVDIRADLYSLGCTLHKLLVGRAPYTDPSFRTTVQKRTAHLEAPIPSVLAARPDVPADLARVIERLLCKDPAGRPADPREVAEALRPFCAGADLAGLLRNAQLPQEPDTPDNLSSRSTEDFHGHRTPFPVEKEASAGTPPRSKHRIWGAVVLSLALLGLAVALVLPAYRPVGPASKTTEPDVGKQEVEEARPVSPRTFTPLVWYNLLERTPTEFFWRNPTGASLWNFDNKSQLLQVNSFGTALLGFGRAEAANYQLQIGFRQTRWVGGVGVFFGGQRLSGPDSSIRCQMIQLRSSNSKDFALVRSRLELQLRPGKDPLTNSQDFSSELVRGSLGNQEYLLELVVRRRDGLTKVRWNGEDYPDLSATRVNTRFGVSDFEGEFGVICRSSAVVVSNARFMLFE